MNEVGFSDEQMKLQLRYDALKERVANQLEMLHMLVTTAGPNIKARYMMFIGRLEYQAYALKVEIRRWKRRLEMRQAALNRGETPNHEKIEAMLEREFAEYLDMIAQHVQELKEASERFAAKSLSNEEDTAVRVAYLNAVKKLHPDLNPDLPKAATDLWNEIQSAYDARDWEAVRLLAALVDSVVSGENDFAAATDVVAALHEACERLEAKSRELAEKTKEVKGSVPFTYDALLKDEDAVKERQNELKEIVAELNAKIKKYEEAWNNG